VSTPEESYAAQKIDPYLNLGQRPDTSFTPVLVSPDNPPWGVFQAVFTLVASLGLLFLLPSLLTLPYLVYRYQGAGVALTRDLLLADKLFVFFSVLSVFPVHFLTLAVVWAVVTQFGKFPFWSTIGWSWGENFSFWKSAALAVALLLAALLLGSLFGGQPTEMEKLILSSRMTAYATALLATATAPIVEELVYRGVVYAAFQRVAGALWATLIVASLFAGIHVWEYWPNVGALSAIVLLSFALTLVRARTGRILPCVIIHLVFNGIQSLFIVFAPYIEHLQHRGGPNAAIVHLIELVLGHLG
jgi:membrane protease YdiL (CAAX protease family)